MKIIFLILFILFFKCSIAQTAIVGTSPSQTLNDDQTKMTWFGNAKLGIFIHWGIYAVDGVDESWAFYNKKMPYQSYMNQINRFYANQYDPQFWAKLIKSSGARYSVITTKHHDGVALWNTKQNQWSIPMSSPAKRDVLTPLVWALKSEGLKVGTYFSLIDWSHPDYPAVTKDSIRYQVKDDSIRWNRFSKFCLSQINEINEAYHPDLFWFDGDWEHSAKEWKAPQIRQSILKNNPNCIINARLAGYGDYGTPEQNVPINRPKDQYWELCMTMNNNWGYQPKDTFYKTTYELISIFADCIAHGGNLLLDIGPKSDGSIPIEQEQRLKELGRWTNKHAEAIFDTRAGLPFGHFYGPSTLSQDSTTLFLFVPAHGQGPLEIKGIKNNIASISIVGSPWTGNAKVVGKISWSSVPGLLFIDLPEEHLDREMTVVKVVFKEPLKLYRGHGGFE
jgi:alpha-L-fucosidase